MARRIQTPRTPPSCWVEELSDPVKIAARLASSLEPPDPRRPRETLAELIESDLIEPYSAGSRLPSLLRLDPDARRGVLRSYLASACGPGVSANIIVECVELGDGESLGAPGPLGYIAVAIKDNMDHPRFETRLGAPYAAHRPARMDPLTSLLVSSGAAVIAKTSMHELALGTTNVNPHYGTPQNPLCPNRITGGSSGGSAAAVAAGIAPLATGNDAGGSVRLPAAYTGVTGFKPAAAGRLLPPAGKPPIPALAAPGLLAATPLDVALALEAIVPPAGRYILTLASQLRRARLRVLVPDWAVSKAEEPVAAAFQDAIETIKAAGWDVDVGELSIPKRLETARVVATLAGAYEGLVSLYREYRQLMGEDVRFLLDIADALPPWAHKAALEALREARAAINPGLQAYDAILSPTAPTEPPRVDEADWRLSASTRLIEYTAPFNALDLPAISIPAGPRLSCGVPLGLQVASARGDLYTLAVSLEAWRILVGKGGA